MNIQTTPRMRVQVPTDDQLLQAVDLGSAMWDESDVYNGMERSVDKMIEFAYYSRANPSSFFNVAVRGDTCHGFMIGERAPYGFHESEFAFDRLLFVTPNMRGGVAARTLINAFETWCKMHKVSRILLGVTTGVHAAQTERLYNKLGYTTVGAVTMKEV